MIGVGYWRFWVLSPVHGGSQTSLPRNICLEWTIRVGVCQYPRLEWSAPQKRKGTTGQTWSPHGLPLTNWRPTLWTYLPFIGRWTWRYSTCCKTHIGTRHTKISQNFPKKFSSGHHPSKSQKMCRKTLPCWLHRQKGGCNVRLGVLEGYLEQSKFMRGFLGILPCLNFIPPTRGCPTISINLFWTSCYPVSLGVQYTGVTGWMHRSAT